MLAVFLSDRSTFILTSHQDDLVKFRPAKEEITEENVANLIADYKLGLAQPILNRQVGLQLLLDFL